MAPDMTREPRGGVDTTQPPCPGQQVPESLPPEASSMGSRLGLLGVLTSTLGLKSPTSQLGRLPRGIGPFWAGGNLLCLQVWAPGRSPNVCRHEVLRARFTCLQGPEDPCSHPGSGHAKHSAGLCVSFPSFGPGPGEGTLGAAQWWWFWNPPCS